MQWSVSVSVELGAEAEVAEMERAILEAAHRRAPARSAPRLQHTHAAARAIRPVVIARQLSGGTRSPRGSATRMRLATLFATWTASGDDPLAACRHQLQTPFPQV